MGPAARMVAALVGQALVYEAVALARGWELISEAFTRWRDKRWRAIVIDSGLYLLVLHLTRRIKARFDPLSRLARWFGRT